MRYLVKYILLFIFGIICVQIDASENDIPKTSSGDVLFYLDHAPFMGSDGNTYVEFYVLIYADQLRLLKRKDENYSIINLLFSVKDSDENELIHKEWDTEASSIGGTDIRTQVFYDTWAELIEPGTYEVFLQIVDTKSKNSGIINTKMNIPSIRFDSLGISGIKFLNAVEPGSKKSNADYLLNPSRRYGLLNPNISFYYELYGNDELINQRITPNYTINKVGNNFSKQISDSEVLLMSTSIGLTRAFDVSKLESGLYYLTIELFSSYKEKICHTSRMFEIIQADYFANIPVITDDELIPLENILSLIAPSNQVRRFEKLDRFAKTNFLAQYFKNTKPMNYSSDKKYLEELYKRYNYSNEKFNWAKKEGWSTDRGRILIQNGFPDEIERFDFVEESKPYEIWYYRSGRQYFYIFGDLYNNGNYTLLHSNKETELFNPSWKNLIDGI